MQGIVHKGERGRKDKGTKQKNPQKCRDKRKKRRKETVERTKEARKGQI